MSDINFLKKYFDSLKALIDKEEYLENLIKVKKILLDTNSKGKKTMIFGNGGSAAISSHFSVDLTKNARIKCTNYNESDLITCFANDFGYERWVEKTINFYGDEGDSLILISAGGNSSNYRTRVTMNWVKEGGEWVVKSQHYSAANYGGVHQTQAADFED